MAIEIIQPGVLTTVQDYGRFGYQRAGIPASGVMDQKAYEDALTLVGAKVSIENRLKGTLPDAVLEATMFGPTLRFTEDTWFAITGANMEPKLNQIPVSMYETIKAQAGDVLSLSLAMQGCRSYIAFSGGIDVPIVMNSRSTYLKCGFGGYEGRALRKGDLLPTKSLPCEYKKLEPTLYQDHVTLRIIEGPQEDYFTEKGKETLYHTTYTVSELSDRMGCRLEGDAIESKNGVDIISDGITFGSIQIPPNGKPIILLADRQTTGGYAKIGTVHSEDLPKLVQLKPGGTIQFRKDDENGL